MTTPRPQPRRRRFLQFSLRSLFVFLVSIGMSWLGVKLERARRQREAVRAIERLGGVVFYSHKLEYIPEGDYYCVRAPPGPAWLRRLLGDDFFGSVIGIELDTSEQVGDSDLVHLKTLGGKLVYVGFGRNNRITDAGLIHLEQLPTLEVLYLIGTQVTPEGVKKLREALHECEIVYDEWMEGIE